MEADCDTKEPETASKLFRDVHYYLIGTISDEAVEMLESGGATEENYLMNRVTHVITEEDDHPEISEARDIFELPVVSPKWISMSLLCGILLPPNPFKPSTTALFSKVVACCTQVSAKDRNALWAMITFNGGRCVTNFTSRCTHLIAGRPTGAKYTCARFHERVRVVTPDWVHGSVELGRPLEEGRYHPRYILTQEDLDQERREREQAELDDRMRAEEADKEEVEKRAPKVPYHVKLPWAEDITPMPELPTPEEAPSIPRGPTPASDEASVSTPPNAQSPARSSTPRGEGGGGSSATASPRKKDKKHKKKKKKKKHKKNKEKEKKRRKAAAAAAARGESGHSTPRSTDGSGITSGGSEKGTPRSMLRNITNSCADFIPNMAASAGQGQAVAGGGGSGAGKRHISQVLNAIAGKNMAAAGSQQKGGVKTGTMSAGPHFGVIPSIPTVQYYGHDPGANLKSDQCLLGCFFLIIEYPQLVSPEFIHAWTKVIHQHGGLVDECYSDRITHILCDTQRTEVFHLAVKDGKRCVTASWLNDCLSNKVMKPPWRALHYPPPGFPLNLPMCKEYVIAVTGFEGSERNDVKTMIELIGATYTGYLSRGNTLLVCRRLEGFKFEKAQEWRIPVVNVRWLSDIILGNYKAFQNLSAERYQSYETEDPFKIEYDIPLPLMAPWTTPLKITSTTKRSFMAQLSIKRKADNLSPSSNKRQRRKSPSAIDTDVWDTPVQVLEPHKIPKVMFTGIDGQFIPDLSKKLEKLGGRVVTDIQKCTHLVTTKVIRTVKFLCGVCCSRYIISPMWIEESYKSRWFLDEANFRLHDPETESLFSFKLEESLQIARRKKLFTNMVLYVTSSVQPPFFMLREIVQCAGGSLLDKRPPMAQIQGVHASHGKHSFVVVSCDADMPQCRELIRNNIDIYNVEFILTSVLRQQLDFNSLLALKYLQRIS